MTSCQQQTMRRNVSTEHKCDQHTSGSVSTAGGVTGTLASVSTKRECAQHAGQCELAWQAHKQQDRRWRPAGASGAHEQQQQQSRGCSCLPSSVGVIAQPGLT